MRLHWIILGACMSIGVTIRRCQNMMSDGKISDVIDMSRCINCHYGCYKAMHTDCVFWQLYYHIPTTEAICLLLVTHKKTLRSHLGSSQARPMYIPSAPAIVPIPWVEGAALRRGGDRPRPEGSCWWGICVMSEDIWRSLMRSPNER